MKKKLTKTTKTPFVAATKATEPKARTMVEVQQEYGQLCTQAGDLHFRVICTQRDLSNLNARLFELNQEAALLNAKAQAEAEAKPATQATAQAPRGAEARA